MRVAGIDYSSHAVDLVTVPLDGPGAPVWTRFPLTGQDAFDRARSVADAMPGRSSQLWDDILAVGIEHPAGHHGTGALLRVQGAILASIPARMLVHPLPPAKWRQLVGLKGNASKNNVWDFTASRHRSSWTHVPEYGELWRTNATQLTWPQDACDAYCIALATRSLIEQVAA